MNEPYTLEQSEEDIAELRGLHDKLSEIHTVADSAAVPNTPANGFSLFSLAGVAQLLGDSGLTGAVPSTKTDTSSNTVTQATTTQLSGQFTVPANDANAGTCYRLKAAGFGTWGSTQQALTLIQILGGANINQVLFTNTDFAASDPFDWEIEMTTIVVTTGSSGTCRGLIAATLNKNNAGVTSANSVRGIRQAGGVTFNTTVSRTIQVNALWNATTGAPTITCDRTTFERIVP